MSVWGAVADTLNNDATLQGLMNGSARPFAWYGRVPQHTALPFIALWSAGGSDPEFTMPSMAGRAYLEHVQLQIDVFAEAPDTAASAMKQMAKLLDFPSLNVDDATLLICRRTGPIDHLELEEAGASENSLDIWHGILLYELTLQRTL